MFVNQLINIGNLCPFIYFFFFSSLFLPRCASLIFFSFYHNYLVDERSFLELRGLLFSFVFGASPGVFSNVTKREAQRNDLANVVLLATFLLALYTRSVLFSKFTPESGIPRHFVSFLFFFFFSSVKDDRRTIIRTIVRENERKGRIHETTREAIANEFSKLGERNCKIFSSSIPSLPSGPVHSSINLFVQTIANSIE